MTAVLSMLAALAAAPDCAAKPPIVASAFAPDGQSVVVGSQLGVKVLRWPGLVESRTVAVDVRPVHDLVFSPDGSRLAIAGGPPAENGIVAIVEWPSGEAVDGGRFSLHEDSVHRVAWSHDGDRLATASGDDRVSVIQFDGSPAIELAGHSRDVLAVGFLPDGTLLSGGSDASLRLWNVDRREAIRILNNHTDAVRAIAVRPGGDKIPMVATAGADRTVRLWQPSIGRLVRFARLPQPPLDIAWTPDGSQLLAVCTDGHLRVIDPETVEIVSDCAAIDGWAYTLAIAADGKNAVVGGSNGQIVALPLP